MSVIALDFDGTVIAQAPRGFYTKKDIGSEAVLKELVAKGHKLVLWTCRNNSRLNPYNYHLVDGKWRKETSLCEAVRWFLERGIPLAGINEYAPGKKIVGESAKVLADVVIDDTALGTPIKEDIVDVYSIRTGRKSKHPRETKYVDWDAARILLVEKGLL